MAGMRNHEVYRNFTKNFRIKKQEIFVPGAISGKHKKDRTIPVMNDYYWDRVKEYLSSKEYTSYINDAMHFLPMRRTQSEKVAKRNNYEPAHVTDGIKRPVWSAVKERFGLEEGFQPYDFRHTFITQLVENMDIHEVVKYSGNSKEMVIRHYASVNREKSRPKFAKIQNRKKGKTEQEKVTQEHPQPSNVSLLINANQVEVPEAALKMWNSFKVSRLQDDDKMLKSDYAEFVARIQKQFDAGKITDDDVEMWLEFQ
jgi:hypothetical protein